MVSEVSVSIQHTHTLQDMFSFQSIICSLLHFTTSVSTNFLIIFPLLLSCGKCSNDVFSKCIVIHVVVDQWMEVWDKIALKIMKKDMTN